MKESVWKSNHKTALGLCSPWCCFQTV